MSVLQALKETLDRHGKTVARAISVVERTDSPVEAHNAYDIASSALANALKIKKYLDLDSLRILNDIVQFDVENMLRKATRHDPRKAADIAKCLSSGNFSASEETRRTLYFLACHYLNNDGVEISRLSLTVNRSYKNNHQNFIKLLEKGGVLQQRREGEIVAYLYTSPVFWNYFAEMIRRIEHSEETHCEFS